MSTSFLPVLSLRILIVSSFVNVSFPMLYLKIWFQVAFFDSSGSCLMQYDSSLPPFARPKCFLYAFVNIVSSFAVFRRMYLDS